MTFIYSYIFYLTFVNKSSIIYEKFLHRQEHYTNLQKPDVLADIYHPFAECYIFAKIFFFIAGN